MASVPRIVGDVYRDGRDAVVPVFGRVVWKPQAAQVGCITGNPAVYSPEIAAVENPYLRTAKQTDGSDSVVESGRHRRPVRAHLHTEIIAGEIEITIETSSGLRGFGPAPLVLGNCRQRRDGQ